MVCFSCFFCLRRLGGNLLRPHKSTPVLLYLRFALVNCVHIRAPCSRTVRLSPYGEKSNRATARNSQVGPRSEMSIFAHLQNSVYTKFDEISGQLFAKKGHFSSELHKLPFWTLQKGSKMTLLQNQICTTFYPLFFDQKTAFSQEESAILGQKVRTTKAENVITFYNRFLTPFLTLFEKRGHSIPAHRKPPFQNGYKNRASGGGNKMGVL